MPMFQSEFWQTDKAQTLLQNFRYTEKAQVLLKKLQNSSSYNPKYTPHFLNHPLFFFLRKQQSADENSDEEMEDPPNIPEPPSDDSLHDLIATLKGMQCWNSFLPANLSHEIEHIQNYFPSLAHFIETEARPHQLFMSMAIHGITEALKQNIDRSNITEDEARELRNFVAIGDNFFKAMNEADLITEDFLEYRDSIRKILADVIKHPRYRTNVFAQAKDKRYEKCLSNKFPNFLRSLNSHLQNFSRIKP